MPMKGRRREPRLPAVVELRGELSFDLVEDGHLFRGEPLKQLLAVFDVVAHDLFIPGTIPARSIAVSRLGPNGLKIEKETTHFHHS